jgi:hypothetical protein
MSSRRAKTKRATALARVERGSQIGWANLAVYRGEAKERDPHLCLSLAPGLLGAPDALCFHPQPPFVSRFELDDDRARQGLKWPLSLRDERRGWSLARGEQRSQSLFEPARRSEEDAYRLRFRGSGCG